VDYRGRWGKVTGLDFPNNITGTVPGDLPDNFRWRLKILRLVPVRVSWKKIRGVNYVTSGKYQNYQTKKERQIL